MNRQFISLSLLLVFAACNSKEPERIAPAEKSPSKATVAKKKPEATVKPFAPPPQQAPAATLRQARAGFKTKLVNRPADREPPEMPPAKIFQLIKYKSDVGELSAYLTPDPKDGQKHPAIIWITGGDCNSIGEVWEDAEPEDDQTAAAYRQQGIVMMFPSLRGGNDNPGQKEGFLGEVNDVLAAADLLAKQPYVDPSRIYLGGHSTGGTLALLVSECSDRFRAVFSFGPVENVSGYPREFLPFNTQGDQEINVRSPEGWLDDIKSPTFVFEGNAGGNISSLRAMSDLSTNEKVHFLEIPGGDHFNILAPMNRTIASKILKDTGATCNLSFKKQP